MSRSGSTVLGLALGGRPGTIFVGESQHFSRQWREGRPCGCGELLNACPFWSSLVDFSRDSDPPPLGAPATAQLLKAASERAGACAVVDSGKAVKRVLELSSELQVDSTLIRLVRDPRGHIISAHQGWRGRRRSDLEPPWRLVVRVTAAWWWNQLVNGLALRNRTHHLVRYEDLVADPDRILQLVSPMDGKLGEETLDFPHVIAGNPVRLSSGRVEFKLDSRWHGMSRSQQLAAYVLGFPFTLANRYPPWISADNK